MMELFPPLYRAIYKSAPLVVWFHDGPGGFLMLLFYAAFTLLMMFFVLLVLTAVLT